MAGPRNAKVGDRIKVVVAQMLERRVKDPRLGFVTITDVRMTGDGQQASVFYTVMGDQKQRDDTAAALRSATGLIRSEVGKQLGTRITPSITFFLDSVPETAKEIEDLLAKVKASDDEVLSRTAGAQYAGDPDPYKKPVDEDDDA
ncbi:30S ribosome-binding factor RbfA [Aeromicrobium wangtongii]|uniref:Ribosome-binding factor A n=1 Tax=Aeromicrobium wangtongii TaxID=2969247 RepID=A0ABY5M5M8_9ACTN|nr:30S ribosome-binding factor RbfA [Aeromicrobium wangtongii]MCD9198437.1 30S ribosome-binding factor RbfA [Aeromicrobium wangtongii]UUP12466.1 30S ribosome-binding factor RbfA [Aeromicrobium wangtongii]